MSLRAAIRASLEGAVRDGPTGTKRDQAWRAAISTSRGRCLPTIRRSSPSAWYGQERSFRDLLRRGFGVLRGALVAQRRRAQGDVRPAETTPARPSLCHARRSTSASRTRRVARCAPGRPSCSTPPFPSLAERGVAAGGDGPKSARPLPGLSRSLSLARHAASSDWRTEGGTLGRRRKRGSPAGRRPAPRARLGRPLDAEGPPLATERALVRLRA